MLWGLGGNIVIKPTLLTMNLSPLKLKNRKRILYTVFTQIWEIFLQQRKKQNSEAMWRKTQVENKCCFPFSSPERKYFFFINHVQITSKHSSITLGGCCITSSACSRTMKETHKRMSLQRGDSTRIYNICTNKHTIIAPPNYYHKTCNEVLLQQYCYFVASRYNQWKIPRYIHNRACYCAVCQELNKEAKALPHDCVRVCIPIRYTYALCLCTLWFLSVCYCFMWQQVMHSIFSCIWNVIPLSVSSPGLWCLSSEAHWAPSSCRVECSSKSYI